MRKLLDLLNPKSVSPKQQALANAASAAIQTFFAEAYIRAHGCPVVSQRTTRQDN